MAGWYGFALGGAGGAVGLDSLDRREQVLEQHRDVLPALLVEHQIRPLTWASGGSNPPARPAADASATMSRSVRASVWRLNEAGSCAHWSASSQGWPWRGSSARARRDLARAHQLDAVELEEDADVVGDVGQALVETARELARAGLAVRAQSFEDALPQRVRQRLGEIRIERPIPSGIRAGEDID